ncbi:MAG: hypothetical protein LBT59_27195 [Clostridiales bacterium]|jgi:hypothetical protein|nr:hypothetical protein [Clostridiales bacterium]
MKCLVCSSQAAEGEPCRVCGYEGNGAVFATRALALKHAEKAELARRQYGNDRQPLTERSALTERSSRKTQSIQSVLALGVGFGIYLWKGKIYEFGNSMGRQGLEGMKNVVAVAAGRYHSAALSADGRVCASGIGTVGQLDVSGWRGIVSLAASSDCTVGVTEDGSVMVAGNNAQSWFRDWSEMSKISAAGHMAIGLKKDGTAIVANSRLDVSSWSGLIDVRAGDDFACGLTKSGKVLFRGSGLNDSLDVSKWKDIISIEASSSRIYGVNSSGRAFSVGSDSRSMSDNIKKWRKIDSIVANDRMCIGLFEGKPVADAGGNSPLLKALWEVVSRII